MNGLINPTNFEFFARYLLAGLIVISVRSRFVVGERPRLTEMLVEAVILSLINQLSFLALASIGAWLGGLWGQAAPPARLVFFLEVLVLPALLGLLFGWNLSRGWNNALLRRLSMPVQSPVRRAYDYAFGQVWSEGFVIVTYTDGSRIYGYFGGISLASTDPDRSDLFLERLYDVGEDDQWLEKHPPRSALVSLSDVRSIEVLEGEPE